MVIKKAFILAAGQGKRMRPLTDDCPKPLLEIDGAPLLWHILKKLNEAGVWDVVINGFYKKEMIRSFIDKCQPDFPHMRITDSLESEPLETGGGVLHALEHFKGDPFFVINGDSFWVDSGEKNVFMALESQFLYHSKGIVLALCPKNEYMGYAGNGDYSLTEKNKLLFSKGQPCEMAYVGVHILTPDVFSIHGLPKKFSLKFIFDKAEAQGLLYGIKAPGKWFHASTPEDLILINNRVK